MDAWRKDPFFNVPSKIISTAYGDIEQPTMYFDCSAVMAMFTTEYERAAGKLNDLELKPGLFWGGKAVVGLIFYEYRNTSIGPYNEVGLGIPSLPLQQSLPLGGWLDMFSNLEKRHLGIVILDLPVTTEIACHGGQEFFGYPKFVTQLPFHLDQHSFHGQVLDPQGALIAELSGRLGMGIPNAPLSMVTYSVLNGRKMRATVTVRGPVTLRGKGGLRLTVGDSDHQMARNLRELGLHGRQPFLVTDTTRFQSRLSAADDFDWSAS